MNGQRRRGTANPWILRVVAGICVIVAIICIIGLLTDRGSTPGKGNPTQIASATSGTPTGMTGPTADPTGAAPTGSVPTATPSPTPTPDLSYDFRICFCGDINFQDGGIPMTKLASVGNDLTKCISPELLEKMNAADITVINNEFTYTTRGTPLSGKAWTFRANPSSVSLLHEMGVDVAILANNHAYDYGEVSLTDTMETLQNAGIAYVGAGYNLEEAKRPVYKTVQGKTIAFVAASRAEKNIKTPMATETKPGILRCYKKGEASNIDEEAIFIEAIREARQNADFVIAIVHWGADYQEKLEQVQIDTAKVYLDAGADAIIGGHSHKPDPIDFYDGKPIVYGYSNFWFNDKDLGSMLLELRIHGDDNSGERHVDLYYTPARQKNVVTTISLGADREKEVANMLKISGNRIQIADDGLVTPVGN